MKAKYVLENERRERREILLVFCLFVFLRWVRGGGWSREVVAEIRLFPECRAYPGYVCVPGKVVRNGSAYLQVALLWGLKVSQCSVKISPIHKWIISQWKYGVLLQS